ncbi:hypothetical protein BaRGS_00024890 [Batillaria attramentaria]|uniref:MYND-type domain-containing protein n=1 Tax=Batillaria attramentaria TaxID=370345 RepID=A0ABD0K9W3_9CAEN
MSEKCAKCHKSSASLRRCTGCLAVLYCSIECQIRDWYQHQEHCKKTPATEEPNEDSQQEAKQKCAQCDTLSPRNLRRCSRCLSVWYCSNDCQRKHWSRHRAVCKNSGLAEEEKTKCSRCEKHSSNLRQCTGCFEVSYCSVSCQRNHWPLHRAACKKPESTKEAKMTGENTVAKCSHCEKQSSNLRRCTGCFGIWYCSNECQRKHWTVHRTTCQKRKEPENTKRDKEERCAKCDTVWSDLRRCTGCLGVWYCSKECQRQHWPEHRAACTKTASGVKPTDADANKPSQSGDTSSRTEQGSSSAGDKDSAEDFSSVGVWICEDTHVLRANMPIGGSMPSLHVDFRTNTFFVNTDLRGGPIHAPVHMDERKDDVHVTPVLTWEEARSRAGRLYPGKRIVDRFSDLENDLHCLPDSQDVVAIARIIGNYFHFIRPGRRLEDSYGQKTYVLFHNPDDPMPYFRYDQLLEGNFFCLEHAHLHIFFDGSVGFRVDYPWDVHMERCAQCASSSNLRRCTGCLEVRYCSEDCQRRDWKRHKTSCRRHTAPKKRRKSLQTTGNGETDHSTTREELERSQTDDEGNQGQETEPSEPGGATGGAVSGASGGGQVMTCQKCKKTAPEMKKCGRCKEVTYCSRDCQRADWRSHKVNCRQDDVIITEGYRQMEERERAERRAAQDAVRRFQHNLLAQFLGGLNMTPGLTWAEARSRAARLFPRRRLVERFCDLGNDFFWSPFMLGAVALCRMTQPYPHPFRRARRVEDIEGRELYVIFYNDEFPWPFFQYSQLREGNFLCLNDARIHLFLDGSVGFRVDDPSDVRIIEP